MGMLDGFRGKDFLEQVSILNEIAIAKPAEAFDGLLELFLNPVKDTSIDYMVANALNAVLSGDEARAVQGIASGPEALRILCIRVAGEYRFKAAVPALVALAEGGQDPDRLMEVLTALFKIREPSTLPVFRRHLAGPDAFAAALCIEMIGVFKDAGSIPALEAFLEQNEADDRFERCEITTWKAVDALAAIDSEETRAFLVQKLHHRNPTVRRIVTDALIRVGEAALPHLARAFEGDPDRAILAANVIGFIGSRKGADALVGAIDHGLVRDANLKYAVYEALGRLGTMKGIVCLVDGLAEPDELILMAVVGGLDRHVNPGVLKALSGLVAAGGEQAARLARAVIASRATRLFSALYESEAAAAVLVETLIRSRDREVVEAFRAALAALGTPRAAADLARLPAARTAARKALAADDSRSMLALHRAILSDLGFEPLVSTNVADAYAHVEQGEPVEFVVTDMNMPVMDGMEFVRKLRATPGFEAVPVIMVTTESEASQRGLAAKSGVTAFITKPFRPDALKAKIKEVLG